MIMIGMRWLILLSIVLLSGCADPQDDGNSNNNTFLPPGQWEEVTPVSSPSPRIVHAMAYDTDNRQVILFGGRDASGFTNDTWSYNAIDRTWKELASLPFVLDCPPIPASNLIVYDMGRRRVLHFGLLDEACSEAQTRVYDVGSNSWNVLTTVGSPQPRQLAAMVYVPDTQQVILFGGETEEGLNNETWIFDSQMNTWQQINTSPSPTPRLGHAMVYDETNKQVILFGGEISLDPFTRSDETWAYDVVNNSWSQLSPADRPSPRSKHAMVYDSANRQILMFGGFSTGSPFPIGDTWIYDPDPAIDKWSQLLPPNPVPERRFLHDMVYASATQEAILFGGAIKGCGTEEPDCIVDPSFYKDDTWSYIRD